MVNLTIITLNRYINTMRFILTKTPTIAQLKLVALLPSWIIVATRLYLYGKSIITMNINYKKRLKDDKQQFYMK